MTPSTQPPEETFCMNCGPDAALERPSAPGGTRTPTAGFVIRNDLLFTTGAWYPQHEPNVPLQVVVLVLCR